MTNNIFDVFADSDDATQWHLQELKIREEPTFVIPFTPEFDDARLHYIDDVEIRSYANCPGPGLCPICHVGQAPQHFRLLPVFSVDFGEVAILRISDAIGPGALGPPLCACLKDPDLLKKVVIISRAKNYRYAVETRPCVEHADRGERRIQAFLEARKRGLTFTSAFLTMSPSELAALPRIRNKLDVIGGFTPTSLSERQGESAAPPAAPTS